MNSYVLINGVNDAERILNKMGKKILIIDDEEKLVSNIKMFLELNGYQVLTAYNGKEGLEAAQNNKPDIIVSDIMMPEMDGYTMLREMKFDETLKDIPVIMLTAKEGMSEMCEIEGASEFLTKPFDMNVLLDAIKKFE